MKSTSCLWRGCGLPAKARGLCAHHYATARTAVRTKMATWKKLEQLGYAKPLPRPYGWRKAELERRLRKAK